MLKIRPGRRGQGASLLAIAAALTAQTAAAQDTFEDDGTFLGTIYVTGEKVVRDITETGSSVSVIDSDQITEEKPGKDDVRTVIQGTPNVLYTDNVSAPIIRGLNTEGPHTGANAFFAGTVPRATVNVDGHYQNYNEFYFGATSVWDVDSIEVFRGPQTTSQGANAIAGAIIVNTKDPTFYTEGAYRLEYGNYNQQRASFAWSGPLSDQVAARIALDYAARDTFIKYNGSGFIQNDIGQDFSNFNARAKLLWAPLDIDGLEVKLTYSHTDTTRPSVEGAAPPYDQMESDAIWNPGWHQTTDTAILDVTYDFGTGWTLSNEAQASWSDVERRVGTPTSGDADVDQQNYTNEFLLTYGQPEDTLSGIAGIYTAYTTQDELLNQGGISTFKDQKHNLGIFGELSWRFADAWTLTGGLRYQRDEIRRTGDVSPAFANSDVDYDETFNEVLPKLTLAYDLRPGWTVGAMVAKGYNPGGVSLDFVSSNEWEEFEAETVWDYELFTRASLLGDRLFLTGNLFYMDYSNAQQNITQAINGITYIHTINADSAQSYGLELAADYRPIDSLTLRGSIGLLHTEFTHFADAPDYEGNAFASAPGLMASLGADWAVTDRITLGGQVRYVDGYYSDTANTAAYEVDSYTLVDVRASYAIRDNIELYGYVNNVFDEVTPVLLQAARGAAAPYTQASLTAPRMFGIGIRGTF
ncbi:MAG: hypothetical protein CML68_18955 [Rhodobacteraceae bacterium]|nr:hypothetical protein [Paracoccaceae bacterium]